MGAPEFIFIAIMAFVFIESAKDKKTLKDWISLIIVYALIFGLLIWGGFFS